MAEVRYVQLKTHYQGGFVFLAYAVAVVGAWTTIELLLRRTGGRGSYNMGLLVGAGVAFGSTATWGMHFVGNQAVTIHLPPPFEGRGIPLSYNIGYTILSLVVACLSMILAFSFIGLRLDARRQPESDSVAGDGARNSGSEKDFDEREAGMRSPEEDSPTQDEIDNKDRRFSWHPRSGSLLPAKAANIINLPRPRKEKEVIAEEAADEAEEDEGEFGTRPAKVSIGGMAKILTAGIIAGGGIAAMHYVGQVSINSVPKVNNVAYIVFLSILIAMVAVTVGLFLLFVVLRPKLQHSWYKRLGVAMILGLATSLMHFVALLGTRYYIVEGQSLAIPVAGATSKHLIIALVCVVTPLCCLSLLVFAFVAQQRVLRQIAARHRIVLAVALFDQQGLLLCQHEDGLLPSAKIYPSIEPQGKPGILEFLGLRNRLSLNASSTKLTRSDPAFIAFLRASWAWRKRAQNASLATASTGVPLDEHLEGISSSASGGVAPFHAGPSKTSVGELDESDGEDSELSGVSVEALRRAVMGFEMAGQEIATALSGTHNLQATGVLYDGILKTGHFEVSSKTSGDSFTVTQGQLLVLTRRIRTNAERDALIDRGYVFAEPGAVARVTSSAFAVPNDRVFDFFRDVHRFSRFGVQKRQDRGRLYGGVLIVQALPGEGLQIVVDERHHHSLPMVELATLVRQSSDRQALPPSNLATQTLQGVVEGMQSLGGLSLHDLANSLESQIPSSSSTSLLPSAALQPLLVNILRPFLDRTLSPETMAFLLPRLIITPTLIPLSERSGPLFGADGVTQDSYLICLKAVIPSSIALPSSSPLNWIPFPLYKAQADCIAKAWGHSRKPNPTGPSRPDTATSALEQEIDAALGAPHSPSSIDVFPPTLGGGKRNSVHSRASGEGDEEDSRAPDLRQVDQVIDPERPAGLPRFDPDYVVHLVKTTIQPSKTWNWDLPTKELRKSGGRV